MNNAIVFTRPNHDPGNNYLYFWTEELIALAKAKNFLIHDLKADKANKKTFQSHIHSSQATFVFLNGHGSEDKVCGHDNDPILECEKNNKLLKDSVVYARSCKSAKVLGDFLVKNHLTKTFIGYKNNFMMMYKDNFITKPLSDRLAQLFLKPSNLVARTLIKGNTTIEAVSRSKKEFQRNISRCMSSVASKEERDAAIILWRDLKALTLLGDQSARITD